MSTATAWPPDLAPAGLTADSRAVGPGFLFAALPGVKTDGRAFIDDALARGAIAVLAPSGTVLDRPGVRLITDDNPRRRFARMAAAFHGNRQPDILTAVTGTNGKTSTALFARQIWGRLGHKAAAIGTLGVVAEGIEAQGGLTTPDPVALHAALAELARLGVTHACLEASSHGLDQYRLDGARLIAAAFTNLTRDHLDYHGTMEAYAQAKLRLFAELVPPGGSAVVNADSPLAPRLAEVARARGLDLLEYGRQGRALRLIDARAEAGGQCLTLEVLGRTATVRLPLAGGFQAANALAALGLVLATGADRAAALDALEHLDGVPGRLQLAAHHPSGAPILVDYAHTPDALETVLAALRPHVGPGGRLLAVFGCGGDRDAGKRPQMGAIAHRLADIVRVTDDNPRGEDPAAIRAAIRAACPGAIEIGDRRRAIRDAVADLRGGDVLVLAGKGHERGQIVAGQVLPFDDVAEARAAVTALGGERP
jgi:UDP-N-acetylmuramoyl-L-alanyl-D-glutamate--2,6-diaminopimelate ligase